MSDPTFREHIDAENALERGTPAPVVAEPLVEAPAPVEATPEDEADSLKPDPEISEAARTLRKSRAERRVEKLAKENDALNEQLRIRKTLREELERSAPAPKPPAPVAASPATDPNDPQPKQEDFTDYGDFLKAEARWAARDEFRKQQAAVQARVTRTAAETRAQAHARTLDEQQAAVREKFSDADDAIDSVLATFRDNPRAPDVAEFLANSQVGGELAYRLGKDAAALKAVSEAASPAAIARELARLEVAITAPTKAPTHITKAPAPPSKTVGSSATASSIDTTKGVSFRDHLRIENEREVAARRTGTRY